MAFNNLPCGPQIHNNVNMFIGFGSNPNKDQAASSNSLVKTLPVTMKSSGILSPILLHPAVPSVDK